MATITGTNGADSLSGTGSSDRIIGLGANDRMYGNNGADVMFGDSALSSVSQPWGLWTFDNMPTGYTGTPVAFTNLGGGGSGLNGTWVTGESSDNDISDGGVIGPGGVLAGGNDAVEIGNQGEDRFLASASSGDFAANGSGTISFWSEQAYNFLIFPISAPAGLWSLFRVGTVNIGIQRTDGQSYLASWESAPNDPATAVNLVTSANPISTVNGEWNHIAVTYSANEQVTLYWNGLQVGQSATGTFNLGDRGNGGQSAPDQIVLDSPSPDTVPTSYIQRFDDLGYWRGEVISFSQIQAIYNDGLSHLGLEQTTASGGGTPGNDTLYGGSGNDTLYGGGANDLLYGETQDDVLHGNSGADRLFGGSSDDTLNGGDDADTLRGDSGADRLFGGNGDDTLTGDTGADTLSGGGGVNDWVDYSVETVGAGINVNLGSGGTDGGGSLDQFDGTIEHLRGTGQNDTVTGNAAANSLLGLAGNDTLAGEGAADFLDGGSGHDRLFGGLGNDRLYGGANDDILYGGGGSDSYFGGTGFDTINYQLDGGASGVAVTVTGSDANGSWGTIMNGYGDTDTFSGIEKFDGNDLGDWLFGGVTNGTQTFIGNNGNDSIAGGRGNDYLIGNADTDRLDYAYEFASLGGNQGVDVTNAGSAIDTFGDTDTLGDAFEIITGTPLADIIRGDAGSGLAETIFGGDGNDTLSGFGGGDSLDGGDGTGDWVSYAGDTAPTGVDVDILAGTGITIGGGAGQTDALLGFEHIIGSDQNDSLAGTEGLNSIRGGGGTDRIFGRGGDDVLDGEGGADLIYGGEGLDTVSGGDAADALFGGADVDTLNGDNGNDTLYGGLGNDMLRGGADADSLFGADGVDSLFGDAGTDRMFGGDQNDWLFGGDNSDVLDGGNGNDSLVGGEGRDLLYGGTGNDVLLDSDFAQRADGGDGSDYIGITHTDPFSPIEFLRGGNGDDTIVARFEGLVTTADIDGDDGTSDFFFHGNDQLYIAGSYDTVTSNLGGGNDLYIGGGSGYDNLRLVATGALRDIVEGGAGNDQIAGWAGDDLLYGDDVADITSGNDTLWGGAGSDTLYGGGGADILYGETGDDTLFGGAGDDWLHYYIGQAGGAGDGTDQYFGGAGTDNLVLTSARDNISGALASSIAQPQWEVAADSGDADGNAATDHMLNIYESDGTTMQGQIFFTGGDFAMLWVQTGLINVGGNLVPLYGQFSWDGSDFG